jgi:hypothetical protein
VRLIKVFDKGLPKGFSQSGQYKNRRSIANGQYAFVVDDGSDIVQQLQVREAVDVDFRWQCNDYPVTSKLDGGDSCFED